nr:hypothetical protein [Tanacetum cinerariifolium]
MWKAIRYAQSFDEVPNPPPQSHFNIYLCQICKSNSHYGYECSQRVPLVYEPEPCYIQNFSDNDYSHDLPGVNPVIDHHCCYECRNSLNDFFCRQCTCEFCRNGAHVGYNCPTQVPFFQTLPSFPQQYPCCEDCGVFPEADHCQPPRYTVNHPIFNADNDLLSSQMTLMEQMTQLTSMCEIFCQVIQKKQEEKRIEEEQAANARYRKIPACCDDDDGYNSAITPNEPSCVENLVPNPSESEGKNGCDVPASFTTFSNILFDAEYEFDSVDDQSCSDEDFPEEIFSNPLFEVKINSMRIDQHHFNTESDLIESLLNRDSSIISSSLKIDSLLDEFPGELTLLKSIPPGIDKTDCYPEEEYSSYQEIVDSDSFMKEIDLTFTLDDPMPPSIKDDDYDSKRDILILDEFPDNYSLSLPIIESFYFDIPSFSRLPAKPPDGNTGILNIKMMGDISEQKNIPILDVPLFYFYLLDQLKYGGNWVKLSDLKQALRGRHPMLISSLVFLFSS